MNHLETAAYSNIFTDELAEDFAANSYQTKFDISVLIHTEKVDLDYESGIWIQELIVRRDYVANIGDVIEVKIAIPLGTFLYEVYDNMENMEVTVRTKKLFNKGRGEMSKPTKTTERYKAVYLRDKNTNIPNNKSQSKTDLNQRLPVTITLQLIERAVEAIRVKTTGGAFTLAKYSVSDFIRVVLSHEAGQILVDNKPPLDFVEVQKTDNPDLSGDITVNSHTPIIGLADYIQDKGVGCYSGGLGCYVQRTQLALDKRKTGLWVYSLYDPDKFIGKSTYVIYVPTVSALAASYPGYVFSDSGVLTIISSKFHTVDDDKEASVMNEGSGFRVANAAAMILKPIVATLEGPVFDRKKVSTEVIYKKRSDGINYAVNKGVMTNNFVMAADVLKRTSRYAVVEVLNIDHDVFVPSGRAEIRYRGAGGGRKDDKVHKVKRVGILHQALFIYKNAASSVSMSTASPYVQCSSKATLRYCVSEPIPLSPTASADNPTIQTA